jgi:hypothetical protein
VDLFLFAQALVGEAKPKLLVELARFVCIGVADKRDKVADTLQQTAELVLRDGWLVGKGVSFG